MTSTSLAIYSFRWGPKQSMSAIHGERQVHLLSRIATAHAPISDGGVYTFADALQGDFLLQCLWPMRISTKSNL